MKQIIEKVAKAGQLTQIGTSIAGQMFVLSITRTDIIVLNEYNKLRSTCCLFYSQIMMER